MATFQPVPKTVEISVQGTQDGQLVENKFYAQAVEVITSTMVDALATLTAAWVHNTMLAQLGNAYTHSRVVARDLSSEASFESINAAHAGEVGSQSGNTLPGNVTLAVHRATPFSGKKQKSRVYWPAIPIAALTSPDKVSSGYVAGVISALETLRENILSDGSATWSYGYPQRILDHIRLAVANFVDVFGHTTTDLNLDSQRRRLIGRGR